MPQVTQVHQRLMHGLVTSEGVSVLHGLAHNVSILILNHYDLLRFRHARYHQASQLGQDAVVSVLSAWALQGGGGGHIILTVLRGVGVLPYCQDIAGSMMHQNVLRVLQRLLVEQPQEVHSGALRSRKWLWPGCMSGMHVWHPRQAIN